MSALKLAEARDIVQSLLDELGLQAYLFEIEPRGQAWELRIDCAIDDEWQSSRLQVQTDVLRNCQSDAAARQALLAQWRPHLASCLPG